MAGHQSVWAPDTPLTQSSQPTSPPANLPPPPVGQSRVTQQHNQEALGLCGPASLHFTEGGSRPREKMLCLPKVIYQVSNEVRRRGLRD